MEKEYQENCTANEDGATVELKNSEKNLKPLSRKKAILFIVAGVLGLACIIGLAVWLVKVYVPEQNTKKALKLLKEGKYEEAEKYIAKGKEDRNYYAGEMLLNQKYDAIIAIMEKSSGEEIESIYNTLYVEYKYSLSEKEREAFLREYVDASIEKGYGGSALGLLEQIGCNENMELFKEACVRIYGEEWANRFLECEVGETIEYGSYEQDNDLSNGKEAIIWKVLGKEEVHDGIELVLISDVVLDTCPETEDADEWLNSIFYDAAFNEKEKRFIEENQYETDLRTGEFRKLKVFCIRNYMLEQYFPKEKDRRCKASDYARYSKQIQLDSDNYCLWWRSKSNLGSIAVVDSHGNSTSINWDKALPLAGVRPMIIVKLR